MNLFYKEEKSKRSKVNFKSLKNILFINISIFKLFIALSFIISISCQKSLSNKRVLQSIQKIVIKVIEPGEQEIIFSTFVNDVQIFINGGEYNFVDNKITVPEGQTTITLQWASPLSSCEQMFSGRDNIIEIDFSEFDASSVGSMKFLFNNCINLKKIIFGESFSTNSLNTMYNMFSNCNSLITLDLSKFDTHQVTQMQSLFSNCFSLVSLDLSTFNTIVVNSMALMFYNCYSLVSLILSENFKTEQVTSMKQMFTKCSSLKSLDLSSFYTSLVTEMTQMFLECSSLEYLDFSHFNTARVTNMNRMFSSCSSLKKLDLRSFNTELVEDMNEMFLGCISLTSLDISSFNTILCSKMNKMFRNCNLLTSLDVSGIKTDLATEFDAFFDGCKLLTSIDISHFNTENVVTMANMFSNCESLTSIDISHFNTEKVTNMKNMFTKCRLIKSLDFSSFVTSQVTNFQKMFDSCNSLEKLDLSTFDTHSSSIMDRMFSNCNSLTSLDISNFNTLLVNDFNNMFNNCNKLTSLVLSSFSTSHVTNMEKMFYNCSLLTSLDLSNFDTSQTINMEKMFFNCSSLTSLDLSAFRTTLVETMASMFESCSNLDYINIKYFTESSSLDSLNMFKNTPFDLIYCIENENLSPNIKIQLKEKDCEILDCDINWRQNYENMIEEKKSDIKVINNKCIFKDIKEINNDFYFSNKIQGVSIYSYDIDSSEEFKKKNTNLTFVELSESQKRDLLRKFGLNEEEKLFVFISDSPSNNSRTATSDYNYIFVLENGTQLNLSDLIDDFYVTVTVPIRDLDLANFDFAKEFSNNGYDIYDKTSDFYNDVCSPASTNDNDIVLKDRKKDIYPNNVTLCKNNCRYKEINLEEQRIICDCNINTNKINETSNENNDFLEENEDTNIANYILDNLNYKIFKCYHLLLNFDNLIKNPAFYGILGIFVIVIFCTFLFIFSGIPKIRINMYKELPTEAKIRKLIIENMKKFKKAEESNPPKKHKKNGEKNNDPEILQIRQMKSLNSSKKKSLKKDNFIEQGMITEGKLNEINNISENEKNEKQEKEKESDNDIDDYNKLPFSKALREDKRGIIRVFIDLLFDKIDLLSLFVCNQNFKCLLICQFLLSLLLDFFFNTLFYSDEIVSHKYHNNGQLDFIITFGLSIISNIISAIVMHFIKDTDKLEDRIGLIQEIKGEYKYLYAISKYLKYLKFKVFCFLFTEIIIIGGYFYYIIIFFIVYSRSQKSLMINFVTSFVEGVVKSLIVIIVIIITRKIGLTAKNKYIYNTSKYINDHF